MGEKIKKQNTPNVHPGLLEPLQLKPLQQFVLPYVKIGLLYEYFGNPKRQVHTCTPKVTAQQARISLRNPAKNPEGNPEP